MLHPGFLAHLCKLLALSASCVPMVSQRWDVVSSWARGSPSYPVVPVLLLRYCQFLGMLLLHGFWVSLSASLALTGLAPSLPMRLCVLRLFSGPLGWCPLRLCLLRLFSGPLGLCRVFLSVCACCAYSLALWAGALCSYLFLLVAPILLWPSGLAPCVPIRLCLLRLFSGPLGWRPVFLSVCAASIPWTFGLAPCVPIRLYVLRLFSDPLGWRPVFLSVCACCAYSLAL